MDVKDLLKEKENIHDYLTNGESSQRWGKNYLCPFHQERTPSCNVNEEWTLFHCFGCGAWWDIFTFLQHKNSTTFYETLADLAEKHGIELNKKDEKIVEHVSNLKKLHWHMREHGRKAYEYMGSRGISENTCMTFEIGYGWLNGYDEAKVLEWIDCWHTSKWYFTLAVRCIFPIHDHNGSLVWFSGRAMDPGQKVKYINSPNSEVFDKSKILYNLHRAKQYARETWSLIVVEWQIDVIQAWDKWLKNVVAACGTGFTEYHVSLIEKVLPDVQVIFCFDNDKAWKQATFRALKTAKRLYPTVVEIEDLIPKNRANTMMQWASHSTLISDVDELLVAHWSVSTAVLMQKSQEWLYRVATKISSSRHRAKLKQKTDLLKKIRKYICYDDPVMVDQQLRILSDVLGIRSLDMLRYQEKLSVSRSGTQ